MKRVSHSPEETELIGMEIARQLGPGSAVALKGELGAGKTVLARGIARGLGIDGRRVSSPTFTLLRIYTGGRLPLYHFDVYRLKSREEFYDLGIDDLDLEDGVMITEWAEYVAELLPSDCIEITIAGSADEPRHIEIRQGDESFSARYEQ